MLGSSRMSQTLVRLFIYILYAELKQLFRWHSFARCFTWRIIEINAPLVSASSDRLQHIVSGVWARVGVNKCVCGDGSVKILCVANEMMLSLFQQLNSVHSGWPAQALRTTSAKPFEARARKGVTFEEQSTPAATSHTSDCSSWRFHRIIINSFGFPSRHRPENSFVCLLAYLKRTDKSGQ